MHRAGIMIAMMAGVIIAAGNTHAATEAVPPVTFELPAPKRVDNASGVLPILKTEKRFLPLTPQQMARPHFRKMQLDESLSLPRRNAMPESLPARGGTPASASGMSEEQAKQILSIFGSVY